jgi:Fatty acid desaturase
MSAPPLALRRRGVLRYSRWDALLVTLAAAHGLLLLLVPAAPVVAVGLWWNSNTVSHHFLHTPFFRSRLLNGLFSSYLSVLLGIPQALWRQRHLAHHAEVPWRLRLTGQLLLETALVLALWGLLLAWRPQFFLTAYLPGYAAGLALCWLQGHYEHARGTVSHHSRLYNALFFNDGYHVEHHDRPGRHWTQLPRHARRDVPLSPWPAVLRWLEVFSLEGLERLVVRWRFLQRFVVAAHERAFRRLLPEVGPVRRAGIVGGGLFPRTALILHRLLPDAQLVVIDASAANLETARPFVGDGVAFVHGVYDPERHGGFDLLVIPLAYVGDRTRFYHDPPGPALLIHDWVWRNGCRGEVVSLLLLKRLNLVKR